METHAWLALYFAALIKAAIPGPVLFLVLARAAGGGLASGLRTALGGILAVAVLLAGIWTILLGAWHLGDGVAVFLRMAGIGVLAALGLRMLRASPPPGEARPARAAASDLGAGLAVGLFNPFNLVFFLVLLPQFVPLSALTPAGIALASALVLLGSILPLGTVAIVGAGQARLSLRGARWMVRGGGLTLLGFAGLAAATPTRPEGERWTRICSPPCCSPPRSTRSSPGPAWCWPSPALPRMGWPLGSR